jgi:hypothetical protein
MQRLFVKFAIVSLTVALQVTHANGSSFAVDGNLLLARCLETQEDSGGKPSGFCVGFVSGVIHMAEKSGDICPLRDNFGIDEIIDVVVLAIELNYQYRSRSAESWVLFSAKKHFCE